MRRNYRIARRGSLGGKGRMQSPYYIIIKKSKGDDTISGICFEVNPNSLNFATSINKKHYYA